MQVFRQWRGRLIDALFLPPLLPLLPPSLLLPHPPHTAHTDEDDHDVSLALAQEIGRQAQELAALRIKNQSLRATASRMKRVEQEKSTLSEQVKHMQMDSKLYQIEREQEQHRHLAEKQLLSDRVQELERQHQTLEERMEKKHMALHQANIQLASGGSRQKDMHQQMQGIDASLSEKEHMLLDTKAHVESLMVEKDGLMKEMDEWMAEKKMLNARMEQVMDETKSLTVQLESLAAANQTTLKRVDQLTEEKTALTQQLDSLSKHKASLASQVNTLMQENSSLVDQANSAASDNETLIQQVETLVAEKSALDDQVQALSESKDQRSITLTEEKNELESRLAFVLEKNRAVLKEKMVLEEEKTALTNEIIASRKILDEHSERTELHAAKAKEEQEDAVRRLVNLEQEKQDALREKQDALRVKEHAEGLLQQSAMRYNETYQKQQELVDELSAKASMLNMKLTYGRVLVSLRGLFSERELTGNHIAIGGLNVVIPFAVVSVEKKSAVRTNTQLKQSLDQIEEVRKNLEAENTALVQERDSARHALSLHEEQIHHLQAQLASVQGDESSLRELQEAHASLVEERRKFENLLGEAQEKLRQEETRFQQERAKFQQSRQRWAELDTMHKDVVVKLQQEKAAIIENLSSEIDALGKSLSAAQKEEKAAKEDVVRLEHLMEEQRLEMETKTSDLKAKLDMVVSSRDAAMQELDALRSLFGAKETSWTQLNDCSNSKILELENQLNLSTAAWWEERQQLNSQVEEQKSQIATLEDRLLSCEAKCQELEQACQATNAQVEGLQSNLINTKEQHARSAVEIQLLAAQVAALDAKKSTLSVQLDAEKSEHSALLTNWKIQEAATKKEFKALQKQCTQANAEKEELVKVFNVEKKEWARLRSEHESQMQGFHGKIATQTSTIKQLEAQAKQQSAAVEKFQASLEEKSITIDDLQAEMCAQQITLEELEIAKNHAERITMEWEQRAKQIAASLEQRPASRLTDENWTPVNNNRRASTTSSSGYRNKQKKFGTYQELWRCCSSHITRSHFIFWFPRSTSDLQYCHEGSPC